MLVPLSSFWFVMPWLASTLSTRCLGALFGALMPTANLISKKTPQNEGAALGMVGSPLQLSGAADAVSSD